MKIFLSYSSKNRSLVETLANDLDRLGHDVWFDKKLSGGQVWWYEILHEIRDCDLFIFALTRQSIDSVPCKLEAQYAASLGKGILPILVADMDIKLLPTSLATLQFVDYRQPDRAAALNLGRALANVPGPKPPLAVQPT